MELGEGMLRDTLGSCRQPKVRGENARLLPRGMLCAQHRTSAPQMVQITEVDDDEEEMVQVSLGAGGRLSGKNDASRRKSGVSSKGQAPGQENRGVPGATKVAQKQSAAPDREPASHTSTVDQQTAASDDAKRRDDAADAVRQLAARKAVEELSHDVDKLTAQGTSLWPNHTYYARQAHQIRRHPPLHRAWYPCTLNLSASCHVWFFRRLQGGALSSTVQACRPLSGAGRLGQRPARL